MDFSHMETQYRSIPFWSWNDKLDSRVLREQIRQMHRAGIGGFFMHARGGLQTEYMSQEWLECVTACLDEAAKLGMEGWLYDENGWPSGFGNGKVNGRGTAYQQKYLRCETGNLSSLGRENTIAWYTTEGKFISRETPADPNKEYLRCYFEVNPYYVDNLDPEVVREFLQTTHEYYSQNIPRELLPHLKGIFTDEPQLSRKGCPWSLKLETEYRREYAIDLLSELPALLLDIPDCRAVRIRFNRLVGKLFNRSFMEQISSWCRRHNWLLTGHHVLEETLQWQIPSNGSVMAQYEHYDIPGMDHLGRIPVNPVTMVQLVSAAMQFGKKQILSESFALTGWNCNFSGMHWIFNQQLAHGINLLCQHLQGYSLRGLRKRDYPSSNFIHQPWWKDYRKVNDFFARAGKLLATGEARTDVVVVHPLSSAWALFKGDPSDEVICRYTQHLKELTETLDAAQINHHYADELITEKYGSSTDGVFRIGCCSYRIVIVPQVNNLSQDMISKLMAFSAAGGSVFKLKNTIENCGSITIDGKLPAVEELDWFNALPEFSDPAVLTEKICNLLPDLVGISGSGRGNILSTRRIFGKDLFYFVANKSYDQICEVTLSLPAEGAEYISIIDGETGRVYRPAKVEKSDKNFIVARTFFPGEAVMFYLSDTPACEEEPDFSGIRSKPCIRKIESRFTIKDAGNGNIFTLDRCRFRVNDGDWEYNDFCVIHPRLLDLGKPCQLEMACDFVLDETFDLDTALFLIVETPEKFEFALNGQPFSAVPAGVLFDQAFCKVPLPRNIHHGVNTITLKCIYAQSEAVYEALPKARLFETEYNKLVYDFEIENIYLLGDFCVNFTGAVQTLDRKAERLCGTFSAGEPLTGREILCEDIVSDGLPFFAGTLKLACRFNLTEAEAEKTEFLRFTPLNANSYQLTVNGTSARLLYQGTYAVCVRKLLHAGENLLELEMTSSLRNMLGPHHLEEGECFTVTTLSFNREPNSLKRSAPPYNENYCFVRLGIKDIELV